MFPSTGNGYSLFLLNFIREYSNSFLNRLNTGNTTVLHGDITSVHKLHYNYTHADPQLKVGNQVIIMNYHTHSLDPRFYVIGKSQSSTPNGKSLWKPQLVLSTRHIKKASFEDIIFSTCDFFKPS